MKIRDGWGEIGDYSIRSIGHRFQSIEDEVVHVDNF